MFKGKPIIPFSVNTNCCVGYKEFTFSGNTFPTEYVIINPTASNYIAAVVTSVGIQTFKITFPSLIGYILNKRNTQIIGSNYDNELTYVYFPEDNTVEISHDALGAFEGIFSIRIIESLLVEAESEE